MLQLAHRDLGLTDSELDDIRRRLGREPTETELAMFSVMWSEHCSYKSSRAYLGELPSHAAHVVVGPGEGAGVVEVAPGVAVAWKIESHNHPSFVEPHNGAATGVGGIVRDVLSMGARPVALLDSLRFGSLDDARARYLVDGVVGGISSYGNSIGVPTVGGEIVFDDCYAANPLVNVACLGVVETEPMRGAADRVSDAVVLLGSATGRDGIGGASILASAPFEDAPDAKRPSVQIGDPLAQKLLIEASLELVRSGLVAGFQDLGAGGICCPASEMAAKSGTGMTLDVGRVHRREPGMEAFEVMISESQERMMAVVEPDAIAEVARVCSRWGLEASVIGEVTSTGTLTVTEHAEVVADVDAAHLAAAAPVLRRRAARPAWLDSLHQAPCGSEAPGSLADAFLAVLSSPSIASKRWAWEQYDHMIFLGTVMGPGGDAAVIRLPGHDVAVALSVDGPGRYCALDPYDGARLAVAEAARNVACVGATPLAVTNCLNLGDPSRPEVMWQLQEVVRGMAEACRALGTPVVGGNVSLYNETAGRAVHPTPVVAMLGVLGAPERAVPLGLGRPGDVLLLAGATDGEDFGGSAYADVVHATLAGRPPRLSLERELALLRLLRAASERRLLRSAHDLSAGGLAVSLAEAAVAGRIGARVDPGTGELHRRLFSESPSRALLSCSPEAAGDVLALAASEGVPCEVVGATGGDSIIVGDLVVSLADATRAYEDALPTRLGAGR
jgi:phosphoribosylformylglycinamidine synthase subunit PurL